MLSGAGTVEAFKYHSFHCIFDLAIVELLLGLGLFDCCVDRVCGVTLFSGVSQKVG